MLRSSRSTRTLSTIEQACDELTVAPLDSVQLVKVDLPGLSQPVHSCHRIIVEEEEPLDKDTSGKLQWGVVQHEQIDSGWQQHIEGLGCDTWPPGRDVDVGARSGGAASGTPVDQGESGTSLAEDGDDLPIGRVILNKPGHGHQSRTEVDQPKSNGSAPGEPVAMTSSVVASPGTRRRRLPRSRLRHASRCGPPGHDRQRARN